MLVVAWVKDWGLGTLATTIAGKDYSVQEIHSKFPFLCGEDWLYRKNYGKGQSMRRYVADYLPQINSSLWDAKDNAQRLLIANRIEKSICVNGTVASKEASEARKAVKAAKAENASYFLSREAFKRNQRSAWDVCKA